MINLWFDAIRCSDLTQNQSRSQNKSSFHRPITKVSSSFVDWTNISLFDIRTMSAHFSFEEKRKEHQSMNYFFLCHFFSFSSRERRNTILTLDFEQSEAVLGQIWELISFFDQKKYFDGDGKQEQSDFTAKQHWRKRYKREKFSQRENVDRRENSSAKKSKFVFDPRCWNENLLVLFEFQLRKTKIQRKLKKTLSFDRPFHVGTVGIE